MEYKELLITESPGIVTITFNRGEQRNSINQKLLWELNTILDNIERNPGCRVIIFEGQKGFFSTGMDFEEAVSLDPDSGEAERRTFSRLFLETVKRLTLIPKVIIAKVDGQVTAGGVGLVAAADLVIATPRSQFNLSEAIWGLLPSMVIPFLIRRVGFQKAYFMTLTTLPVPAEEALRIHLVDEVNANPEESIQRLCQRLLRLEEETLRNMKQYFRKMWIITEMMEETAVAETARLIASQKVQENIKNFINYKKFPWENR